MVRSVDSIRRELDALKAETQTLASEFDRLYTSYLDVLGQAIKRHLVIATYQLCTQIYPESFLSLSVGQRERLQQAICKLGLDAKDSLQQLMSPNSEDDDDEGNRLAAQGLEKLEGVIVVDGEAFQQGPETAATDPESEADMPTDWQQRFDIEIAEPASEEGESYDSDDGIEDDDFDEESDISGSPIDARSLIQSVIMAAVSKDLLGSFRGRPFSGDNLTPTVLAKQHLLLEHQIRELLQQISKKTNVILRSNKIIPDLPEAVLDAASEAESVIEKGYSAPNLLNVMVEMSADAEAKFEDDDDGIDEDEEDNRDDDDDDDEVDEESMRAMMTHLAAIHLRLSDIEFADVPASMWRSKLRTVLGRLRKLGKQYQKAEREYAIAEAEQAWRAVWYDDSAH